MLGMIPLDKTLSREGRNEFHNMMDDLFMHHGVLQNNMQSKGFKLDLLQRKEDYLIEAEIPGVRKENIKIDADNNQLTITVLQQESNEMGSNSLKAARSIYLQDMSYEGIQAKLKDGVLEIVVPKLSYSKQAARIEIETV